jgi:hypothetical protein
MLVPVSTADGNGKPPSPSCPHSAGCPLYPQFTMASFLRYWRTSYCDADFKRCARYRLSEEGKPVPVNLLPSGNLMKVAPK